MLRLVDYKNQSAGKKLELARMPVIIMHGADDPLVPAQDIAHLASGVKNPKVAAIILPSGGHVGFAGYAPEYYFSLVMNFFDPQRGAAAGLRLTHLAS
jgi:predicted alpha/beta-fold hydrolase